MDIPFKLPLRLEESQARLMLVSADHELIADLVAATLDEARAIVYLINTGGATHVSQQ